MPARVACASFKVYSFDPRYSRLFCRAEDVGKWRRGRGRPTRISLTRGAPRRLRRRRFEYLRPGLSPPFGWERCLLVRIWLPALLVQKATIPGEFQNLPPLRSGWLYHNHGPCDEGDWSRSKGDCFLQRPRAAPRAKRSTLRSRGAKHSFFSDGRTGRLKACRGNSNQYSMRDAVRPLAPRWV